MDTLEIDNTRAIHSIPTYFGSEKDEDIPDMAGFDDSENLVEEDPVCLPFPFLFPFLSIAVLLISNNHDIFN